MDDYGNGRIGRGDLESQKTDLLYYSTIVPFLDKKGKPYQYIAISSDITDQKKAQKTLNNALIDIEKRIEVYIVT
jgi:hypothetical protein